MSEFPSFLRLNNIPLLPFSLSVMSNSFATPQTIDPNLLCPRKCSRQEYLECVVISFSRGSSRPRDQTHISCLAGGFFTMEPPGNPSLLKWHSGKESTCQCRRHKTCGFNSWTGKILGEGTGKPPQYSYLENPMYRGAWQAAVHAVIRVGYNLATKPQNLLNVWMNFRLSLKNSSL